MKKIETHAHTSGISYCSEIKPEELPALFKNAGIDTFMLTNHYCRFQHFGNGMPFSKQLKAYLDEYRTVKKAGEKIGVSVLLGAEVGIATPKCDYTEFVLFGVMEKFLLSSPALHLLSQPALYNLCHDNGILMYQAHPFRIGHIPADPGFMDGVEINLHRNFLSNTEEVYEFADKYSLGVSLGSDVHYHNQPGAGAILAPDDIKTSGDLAKFLKTTPRPQLYRR